MRVGTRVEEDEAVVGDPCGPGGLALRVAGGPKAGQDDPFSGLRLHPGHDDARAAAGEILLGGQIRPASREERRTIIPILPTVATAE